MPSLAPLVYSFGVRVKTATITTGPLGALFECLTLGTTVPGDVSITGFDGLDLAGQIDPPLTTVHIPSYQMGRRSAEYLIARLNDTPVPDKTRLEPSLIIRNTTAPPRQ